MLLLWSSFTLLQGLANYTMLDMQKSFLRPEECPQRDLLQPDEKEVEDLDYHASDH